MLSPCKNCNNRQIGCHIVCEQYKAFKKERQALNTKIRRNNEYSFIGSMAFCLKRI